MMNDKPVPDFYIGKSYATEMIRNYLDKKYPLLNSGMPDGRADTKSIWYSMKHFEELYKELIYLNANGIRFYLGAYPPGSVTQDGDDISNQLCVVMVPTFYDTATMKQKDIIPEDTDTFSMRLGSERFIGDSGKNAELNDSGNKGYDQGALCPPVCLDQDFQFPVS